MNIRGKRRLMTFESVIIYIVILSSENNWLIANYQWDRKWKNSLLNKHIALLYFYSSFQEKPLEFALSSFFLNVFAEESANRCVFSWHPFCPSFQYLFATYVAPSATLDIGLQQEKKREIYMKIHPPFEDLFDTAEEYILLLLLEPWMKMVKSDQVTYRKVLWHWQIVWIFLS